MLPAALTRPEWHGRNSGISSVQFSSAKRGSRCMQCSLLTAAPDGSA